MHEHSIVVFPSELGWMCIDWYDNRLRGFTFGHASPQIALAAARADAESVVQPTGRAGECVRRLQRFAEHCDDDLLDIELDLQQHTAFQRRVVQGCRGIAIGTTLSYGQLAELAGHPGAARAVGQVMATNRYPLIVPCHRVVGSGGSLGGYSAPDGLTMKRRLLEKEAQSRLLPVRRRGSGLPAPGPRKGVGAAR